MECEISENNPEAPRFSFIRGLKRPLFIALAVGIVLRVILAFTLTYEYDVYHWAVIMQNINSGNGLYELTGYFYLPVWGYIMGFFDLLMNTLFSIDVFGNFITSLIPITDLKHIWHLSTITTPAFNLFLKIPLIIVDLIVGWLVYKVAKMLTDNKEKAEMAFALWFLCPIVFYMTGVQIMFDNISALFLLLCIVLLMRQHYLLAGGMLALASLLKIYPAACALIFVIYILKKHGKDEAIRGTVLAVIGFIVCAALVMLPNIMQGNIASTLTFLTDRGSRNSLSVIPMILVILLELFLAWRFTKEDDTNIEVKLMKYSLCAIVIMFITGFNPQYVIVYIPLLALCIVTTERHLIIMWWATIFIAISACVQDNFSLLCSSVVYYGWLSPEWIVDMMNAFEVRVIFDATLEEIVNNTAVTLFNISLVILVIICLRSTVERYIPKVAPVFDYIEKKWGERDA